MSNTTVPASFGTEMKRRFEELTAWAIDNCPDRQHPLNDKDFSACRQQIALLADRPHAREKQSVDQDGNNDISERNKAIPEPADSGPQYVNVTPNPWP